jgi:LTXXQ motif family protein
MIRTLVRALAVVAVSASAFSLTAAAAEGDQQSGPAMMQSGPAMMERMQHLAVDRATLLEAKLAGMKAGLQLTADQEKLWIPFESAVKDAAKARMEAMQKMMQTRGQEERMSPVDRLQAMADHLSQGGANLKKIVDAAKPLYDSLDESQKHNFAMLGRDMLMPEGAGSGMEWMHRHMDEHEGDGAE